ncbi:MULTISPECIES: CerR family C-terminal domain-containing protein [Dethiosulfovibrio]|uniref:CerR family C-terminal domain-containing protein n=2 Tax=Dethiosulfovibrio TaxID=47054 RepID=A0ABS9EQJ4_9BACT|nr:MULTISPECIES: CerR family C-terminal domain-containing protein [Dethiosulfovibrio]MCF4115107.1 CerR family C-terminal domain-containing protein [Dethiosulfovibrio russensis]MCF4143451.1 CerR family C-terminal domain-containing protein [Dethiosulfovibrio marinus]MCF4145734.1 CerR family C-terminal domain-containing protein [Dethiosulfovibrio acidaminovorans]
MTGIKTTKQKILDTAGIVFGENSYNEATIREICSLAEVNLASVNYHFGSKEMLYRALLEDILTTIIERHPAVPPGDHSAEERLAFFLRAYVNRLVGEARIPGNEGRIALLSRELLHPSPIMTELMVEHVYPQRDILMSTVAELLGDDATRRQVLLCVMSSVSQCFYMIFFSDTIKAIGLAGEARDIDMDTLARHAATFALAGIKAIREGGKIDG